MNLPTFTGERIEWQNPHDHLKEFAQCSGYYFEAMQHAKGKTVIDAACGSGFGTFLLSLVAKQTVGFDVREDAEAWRALMKASPTTLVYDDLNFEESEVPIPADLVVSIETIEHLANPDFFLAGLKAKELFFTVPCYGNKNEFHKIEYDEAKCAELIKRHFPNLTYHMDHRRMIGYATK